MSQDRSPPHLSRLLRPRSIALFGGRPVAEIIRQSRRIGFTGEIWPVHPTLDEMEGLRTYRSVAELPGAPDAAFVAVNRHLTIEIVAGLAARGAGGAICYASGFAEAGDDGPDLQAALIEAAGSMPLIGPNCYGTINYLDRVALWPDQHGGKPVERGVALVTQSGNIGLNLTMQRRAVPVALLITLGNQAVIGLGAIVEALLEDERVTAIGLHIEGIDDPAALARAAARARRRGVPIVALKTGRSAAGARLTISHTASLAGADAAVDAFLRKIGIVRVASIPVLLETIKLLHLHGPLPGRAIASMSCSGGEAALIADAVETTSLSFRPLTEAQAAGVAATLPDLVTISNPLDYHTFSWAKEATLTRTFAAMLSADYDLTLLILDFPRTDRCDPKDWDTAARALAAAARTTGRRAGLVTTLPESLPEDRAEALAAAGIVPLYGIDDALAAMEAAAHAFDMEKLPAEVPLALGPVAAGAAVTLSEWEGKQALAAHGLAIPSGRLVATPEDAAAAAEALGYPVVVKAVGRALAHKTELGAVKLNLRDAAAVQAAAAELSRFGGTLLVERMVTDCVAELIIGVVRDPAFGLTLVIGSGGILVELLEDSRTLLMPAMDQEIRLALSELRIGRLLDGWRGKPPGDKDALIAAVLAIQSYALAHIGTLVELDVNPLMVRPQGNGAIAVDALIRLVEEPT